MSINRKRLSPEASRDAALDAARALLIEAGPQALTLKAVAARIGRTHANLLHHFGSAAGLQQALIARMTDEIAGCIADAVLRARSETHDHGKIVALVFDAFGKNGGGALATWMILTGNQKALDPILEQIRRLVDLLGTGHEGLMPLRELTLQLLLMAAGDAMLGDLITHALGVERDCARYHAGELLKASRTGAAG